MHCEFWLQTTCVWWGGHRKRVPSICLWPTDTEELGFGAQVLIRLAVENQQRNGL